MYNYLLDTLIAVVKSGSFTKASEKLYLSPTAVMKQINTLEKQLDLKLLRRTPNGCRRQPLFSGSRDHRSRQRTALPSARPRADGSVRRLLFASLPRL